MSEKKTVAIVLEARVLKRIKIICTIQGWSLGRFYESAINAFITKVELARINNTGIPLREMPENLQRASIWMCSSLSEEIFEKSPGIFKKALLYTAIHDYLDDNFDMEIIL